MKKDDCYNCVLVACTIPFATYLTHKVRSLYVYALHFPCNKTTNRLFCGIQNKQPKLQPELSQSTFSNAEISIAMQTVIQKYGN